MYGKTNFAHRCDTAEDMMLNPLREAVYRYKNNPEEVAIREYHIE